LKIKDGRFGLNETQLTITVFSITSYIVIKEKHDISVMIPGTTDGQTENDY
jgi:hypothetical protein